MKNKKDLIRMIEELSHDPIWECYTRAALQLRWEEFTRHAIAVVYCDIDDMHGLNSKYTHAEVDRRIAKAILHVRHDSKSRHGDVVASRWLNGDELVFIIASGEAQAFCERIQATLLDAGINATFAHSYVVTEDPQETINPLDGKVNERKNKGQKGTITAM